MSRNAEALLPGTDAIPADTIEWSRYRHRWLVRYRNAAGVAFRTHTASHALANEKFEEYLAQMRREAQGQKEQPK